MNVPATTQPAEVAAGPRPAASPRTSGAAPFGEALGEALDPAAATAPPRAGSPRGARRREASPRQDAPSSHEEPTPQAEAGALAASGLLAPAEAHARRPQAKETPSAGGEGEAASAAEAAAPHRPARPGPPSPHGVVRVRPEGAQLAAKLGVKAEAAPPAGVPPRAARGAAPAADRERPKEKPRARELPAAEAATAAPRTDPTLLLPAAEPRAPRTATASAAAQRAGAPLPPPPPGQEVSGAVLRSAAHLKVDTGTLGALELHLRVRDGALHLRVTGEAAPLVEARSGELSRALAGEGLRLAPVELPPGDGTAAQPGPREGREQRRQAWDEAGEARQGATPSASRPPPGLPEDAPAAHPGGHRIDVKA
jgi:hypothetical protein